MIIYNEVVQPERPCVCEATLISGKYFWLWNLNVSEEDTDDVDQQDSKKYTWWSFQGTFEKGEPNRFDSVIEYCRFMISEFPDDVQVNVTVQDYIDLLSMRCMWGPDKSNWDYGEIIQGLLKWKYTNDEIQAIQNNYLDVLLTGEKDTKAEQEYKTFSEYRKSCKQTAKQILA